MKSSFAARVIAWQKTHGRHDLPWQGTRDAYRIWLSEVMLQQTQVATVIPYYQRFVDRFPTVQALATAESDEVMSLWSGLGYYSRARHLHACARAVVADHAGQFPATAAELVELPGIGESTAAAIAAFAFGARAAILDGNVKRVFARHFGVAGWPGATAVQKALWAIAAAELPERGIEPYTQGLMDLGATVCTRGRPACEACPVSASCVALKQNRIGELPSPRPARARPVRYASLALLLDGERVLLEQRAATGIWGGLSSLPEFEPELDEAGFAAAVAARYGLGVRSLRRLDDVVHDFSHYRFVMQPWFARITPGSLAEVKGRWLDLTDTGEAPLPAPVKRLLLALA
ncbi:MAG: A/G-specific adenine glycosylase [Burkholderiaceae bacterium]